MVIYTTDVAVLVVSPAQLVSSLGDVVTQAGGYVAGVENKDEGGIPVTTIRLKIPAEKYESAMRQIRGLAVEVTSEKATTQDVTEEFSDVQTQLRALEASHAQLLELLGKAQNIDEILKIQEKLAQTKTQIDRLKGRETFLQRNAELATVTVTARPAEDVIARTFSTLRSSLRRAETQRAQTLTAIQRARTPEEEATLRDRLGEVTLEINQLTTRIADVEQKAKTASITLPAAPQDDPAVAATTDQDLLKEYLRLVGERRAAEAERDRLTREQRQNPTPEMSQQLQQALLRVATLDTQTKAIEERARRASIALPSLSADQIAALAGLPPESWWSRQDTGVIVGIGALLAIVGVGGLTLGRRLFRRRRPDPTPSAA
jgi:chromosome segregation ATPase